MCEDADGELEGWEINEDVLTYIADTEQEPGIKIIRKDGESKSSDVNPVIV